MRVWDSNKNRTDSLHKSLNIDISGKSIITLVGGGGKTSTMYCFARELERLGKRVIITTTTHVGEALSFPTAESIEQAIKMADEGPVLAIRRAPDNPKKRIGYEGEDFERLKADADILIVEADGAKRLPLKAAAPWEPVIPEGSDYVVALAGIDGVGLPIEKTCHRPELVCDILKKSPSEPVTVEDVAKLLTDGNTGQKKGVGCQYRILINKADDGIRRENAFRLAALLSSMGEKAAVAALRDSVAAVLLAAGQSKRFGANKLVQDFDGRPMYEYAMDALEGQQVEKKIIVTRNDQHIIIKKAKERGFDVVINPSPERGIASSVRLGVMAAADIGAGACLFAVCDQPNMDGATIERLIDAYQYGGRGMAAVSAGGVMGNPNIFSSKYFDELSRLEGDTGGRQVLERHKGDVSVISVESLLLADVDTMEGLEKLRAKNS